MTRACLRSGAVGVLSLLGAAVLAVPVVSATEHHDEPTIRTEAPEFGGYAADATGAPLSVLFFEPVIPIPVDPGEPHFEVSESYTRAVLSTGPTARALASSLWPGPAFGDGWSTITEQEGQEYPIRADARYPEGPQEDVQELPTGAGMRATAHGLDIKAEATTARSPSDELVSLATVSSMSYSTVLDGVVIATTEAALSGVALLEGLVSFDGIRTTLEARSDAADAATHGVTEVQGLRIAGFGYALDQDGLRPVADGAPGESPLPAPGPLPGAEEIREALGIEVELVPHVEEVDGADARRSAGGVRVTVDTTKLRDHVDLVSLLDALPEEFQELTVNFYSLLSLSPRIVFILGRGHVRAAATEPFVFNPPDLPPLPAPAPMVVTDGSLGELPLPGFPPGGDLPSGPSPETAPGDEGTFAVARTELPELFDGLPIAAVVLALVAVALAARGLRALSAAAIAPSGICTDGSAQVPNLRGGG